MNLNAYAAEKRLRIYDELRKGLAPSEGAYDEQVLRDARTKGQVQMGSTHYEPYAIVLEFIYPDPKSTAAVLEVRLAAPERIVFMPIPGWVIEQIWQGEIMGSHHFESEANRLLESFSAELSEDKNLRHFGPAEPKRRG